MLIKLFMLFHTQIIIPEPQVEILADEIEAVWIPADWSGPVVAIPLTESGFEVGQ